MVERKGQSAGVSSRGPRSAHTPSPAVFDLGSAIAATLLVVSTSGLIYLGSTQHINRSTVEQALWHPPAIACIASFLGALLYMLVRHGVPYKSMPGDGVVPSTAAIARQNLAVDTDVIVVGAGTVGAALATVLARDGKRVLLIERNMSQVDRIVGELLQPGGVRALERMGLGAAAKGAGAGGVVVDGYVCLLPGSPPSTDLILTYPERDPASTAGFVGLLGGDPRPVRVRPDYVAAGGRGGSAMCVGVSATPAVAADDVVTGRRENRTGSVVPKALDEFPVDGVDAAPHGRSFWNHRFVHELRLAALAESLVTVCVGSVRGLVTRGELADTTSAAAATLSTSRALPPPPRFAGYDAAERPIPYAPTAADKGSVTRRAAAVSPDADPRIAAAGAGDADDTNPSTICAVRWIDEAGHERVSTARLVVLADGMFSTHRAAVTGTTPQTPIASYFCGLVLHHAAGVALLPYPNRGHVVLADPNPVLLYQISPTETRVLVDVPEAMFKRLNVDTNDGLRRYFTESIAPQLPLCLRAAFLEANATQEPMCMANRRLTAIPPKVPGAVLVGDSFNMRHPLTGGGMTVALKDVELLAGVLAGLDLTSCGGADIAAAIARFSTERTAHAATINVLANALHRVFTKPPDDDGTRARLRAACVHYMGMGGPYAAGPVGLLAGLTPVPSVLVAHFFAVAAHATWLALTPVPTPARIRQGYDLLRVACIIIMPLLEAERATLLASRPILALIDALFPWRTAAQAAVTAQ